MRVLITLPVKIGFDGMTKQVLSYSEYMDKADIEIDLLSCRGYDPDMVEAVNRAGFHHVYRLEYRDTNPLKYFMDLLNLMQKNRYDIIHVNGQSATMAVELVAARISGIKLRIAHSHNSKCTHMRVHKLLYPIFIRNYTTAIGCGEEAGKWLFGDRPFIVLNNGIDTEVFKFSNQTRLAMRKKLALKDTDIAIGSVAAFEPWKNHTFMIDILEELAKRSAEYKLFMWGIDGTTKDLVLEKIHEKILQDCVFYRGTSAHIHDYLNAMDIMLLPSWYEGFPVTAVEWQANGLPCLISDTITREIAITDLVSFHPIDNTKTWVDKIIRFKEEGFPDRRDRSQELRNSGLDIRENVKQLVELYKGYQ